ncbi:MAG TPA: class A beta-lactamase [Gemmatimonadales bacterium]|jgi:beta-lactamase class A
MMRRRFLAVSGSALLGHALSRTGSLQLTAEQESVSDLATIERAVGGRLGVVALDVESGARLAHRPAERFPMCSTFKWLLAAQVLARADSHDEDLDRIIHYGPGDLLEYAPITRQHVGDGGMTVSALLEAAVEYSDNTAANLLLATVGGPSALTAFLRHIGDRVTRVDRVEPDLNSAIPGDLRDTTTPEAMAADLRVILLGNALTTSSRDRLTGWLERNTTGGERLRAGFPTTWRVGDKTGTGSNGSTNDVAVVWPASDSPALIAAFLTQTRAAAVDRNAALAQVGRFTAAWIARARR